MAAAHGCGDIRRTWPELGTFMMVRLDGARSAEPPIRPGSTGCSTFSIVWECARDASACAPPQAVSWEPGSQLREPYDLRCPVMESGWDATTSMLWYIKFGCSSSLYKTRLQDPSHLEVESKL